MKLNEVIYNKILLQAEEAKVRGMKKMASAILSGVGATFRDEENFQYSSQELNSDVYKGLWKLAFNVLEYHDLESVDIEKIDEIILKATNNFIKELEERLDLENQIGPNEPKLIGEK